MAKSKNELEELQDWDVTLNDGLEDLPYEEPVVETPKPKKVSKADYYGDVKISKVVVQRGSIYDVLMEDGRVETIHKDQITRK